MRERGVDAVAMEVSSHALVLGRVDGCVFDIAVFNNLSPEHMEFHSDMEDYFRAKAQLFTPERSKLGVINLDDAYGRRLAEETTVPVVTFSAEGHPDADWRAEEVEVGPMDSVFVAVGPKGERITARSPLAGPFNVANTLAAIVALAAAGLDPQTRPTASPPSRASQVSWSAWTRASPTSRWSTTPTRRTPSSRCCARCARSPRAYCTSCSAAAVTAT